MADPTRTHYRIMGWIRGMTRPFHWREAGLCVPALPILLGLGLWSGHFLPSVIAAGAAFSVGFGASRELKGRRLGAMVVAALGMSVAALLGSLAGQFVPVLIVMAGVAAAGCAALALFDEDLWWISLQVVIAMLVASYYPGSIDAALERAGTVLGGGVIQIASVALLSRLVPRANWVLSASPAKPRPTLWLLTAHVTRAAICVPAAIVAAHMLGLANSYWAPMTALIVLKPGLHETRARGVSRLAGTLMGGGIATLFAAGAEYSQPLLFAGMTIAAGLSFAWQKAHYALLSAAITATIVLLLSLAHGGVVANVEHRLIATALGGSIALLIAHIAPHRPRVEPTRADIMG
jgi:hypothetical protein